MTRNIKRSRWLFCASYGQERPTAAMGNYRPSSASPGEYPAVTLPAHGLRVPTGFPARLTAAPAAGRAITTTQLTLEQPGFEQHGSTYTQIFFNNHRHCFRSTAGSQFSDIEGLLYTLIYATVHGDVSICGFWCLQGILAPIPCGY